MLFVCRALETKITVEVAKIWCRKQSIFKLSLCIDLKNNDTHVATLMELKKWWLPGWKWGFKRDHHHHVLFPTREIGHLKRDQGPVSGRSIAVLFSIPDGSFKRFENCIIKLSAKETKWTLLKHTLLFLRLWFQNMISRENFTVQCMPVYWLACAHFLAQAQVFHCLWTNREQVT